MMAKFEDKLKQWNLFTSELKHCFSSMASMCVCVCVCVYTCVCRYVCVYVSASVCACVCMCMHVCICVWVCVSEYIMQVNFKFFPTWLLYDSVRWGIMTWTWPLAPIVPDSNNGLWLVTHRLQDNKLWRKLVIN